MKDALAERVSGLFERLLETEVLRDSSLPAAVQDILSELAAIGARVRAERDMPTPELPDNNPKTIYGVQKAPLHLIPPPAMLAEAWVFGLGAQKYGPYNWRENNVSASVYQAAAFRHMMAWWQLEDVDQKGTKE